MSRSSHIWTGEILRSLYAELKARFGPLDGWEKTNSPGAGRDAEYDRFCNDIARQVGAASGDAVKLQVRFAMPETANGSKWEDGHVRTAILNEAAALEEGFIGNKHLPESLHAVGHGGAALEALCRL